MPNNSAPAAYQQQGDVLNAFAREENAPNADFAALIDEDYLHGLRTVKKDARLVILDISSTIKKLLITGGNNVGGSPYYIMCEDKNGHDQFYVKGGTSSNGTGDEVHIKGNVGIGGLPVVNGLTIWDGLRVNGIEFGPNLYGGSAGLYRDHR